MEQYVVKKLSCSWVLTAAHCVYGKTGAGLSLLAGDHDVRARERGEQRRDVCRVTTHPHYGSRSIRDDLGLLRVCRPFVFSMYVQPLPLPRPQYAAAGGQAVMVAGWGAVREQGKTAGKLRYKI